MRILSWNVNGVQARLETISQLVGEIEPDLMCFQKVRKKGTFLTQILYEASGSKICYGQ